MVDPAPHEEARQFWCAILTQERSRAAYSLARSNERSAVTVVDDGPHLRVVNFSVRKRRVKKLTLGAGFLGVAV